MVTFVTLFLSLIHGVHPVQVAVDGPVARVEVVLDDHRVTALTRPPWIARCDFGPLLKPHELVAVAYDADGNELDRARQLVNLPRPAAEARIALESDAQELPVRARVFWESADPVEPLGVYVTFDGLLLHPDPDGGYVLPGYDGAQVHIVSAEVEFPEGLQARADATFGGRYGSRVTTDLTAVPVLLGRRRPRLGDLDGALVAGGAEVVPVALERPGARVYLVRDQAVVPELAAARRRQTAPSVDPLAERRLSPAEDRLRMVLTHPIRRKDRELFPTSTGISLGRFDLDWLAANLVDEEEAAYSGQQLADAVAVAGVQAAAEGAPRAVVLLLSTRPRDGSTFSPVEVRRYLESLRVPLYVWSTHGDSTPGWGPAVDVTRPQGLRRAATALRWDLKRQWVVWIRGTHMINRVELAAGLQGVALAGVPPRPPATEN